MVEGSLYVIINVRMLKKWVSMGKLKSLVNKFLAANRLHGLVIVPILTLDPVFGFLVPVDVKVFYCRSIEVILFYLSLNFWTNSFIIAVIRYIFFKFPIKMHNWFPKHREKQVLFHRLLSVSWCLPMVATAVFQTAIITLGAKSQKVQARSKRMSCVGF